MAGSEKATSEQAASEQAPSATVLSEVPAERHRQIAALFTERVHGTHSWDAPAPVEGWTARDVVRHLIEWLPALLTSGAGVELPHGPSVDDDPVAAWQVHCDGVQAILDDPQTEHRELSNPHIGRLPLATAIDQFYTSDVFMHTWDLARATGQDDRLDPAAVARAIEFLAPIDEAIRRPGGFGPRIEPPAGADAQTRLLNFGGRAV